MNMIDKSYLSKNGKCVDWNNSIGCEVPFKYKNIEGKLTILDYKNRYVTIKIDDKIGKIHTSGLLKCGIGEILGVKTNKFKYEVGDIFKDDKRDIIIINKEYRENSHPKKWYKYKCNIDNNEDWIGENDLTRGVGCNVCSNKKVLKGINDIHTKRPDMIKYLYNKEDSYKYTEYSGHKIHFKCPECGLITLKTIFNVSVNGFSCKRCSEGISYPNKFMMGLLEELNIEYISEYSPKWLTNIITGSAYDFYIPSKKLIIEMDGGFHKKGYHNNKKRLNNQIKRDNIKNKLAIEHDIEIVRIDCDYKIIEKRSNFIKMNVCESKLKDIFSLRDINWHKVYEFATVNLVKNICKYYEANKDKMNLKDIAKKNNIYISTLIKYLKIGNECGWCVYKPSKKGKRKVKVTEIDRIYESTNSCAIELTKMFNKKYGQACISNACLKNKPYKGLHFEFVDD